MAEVQQPPMCSGLFRLRRRWRPSANDREKNAASDSTPAEKTNGPSPAPLTPPSPKNPTAHEGRPCLDKTHSELRHDSYIAKLEVPTLDEISSIAQIQEEKEREVLRKYEQDDAKSTEQEATAAGKIQRVYRGHRARREMQGLTLDPTTRWIEALKAARYHNITKPGRRRFSNATIDAVQEGRPSTSASIGSAEPRVSTGARNNWHHVSSIAAHAIGELPTQPEGHEATSRPQSNRDPLHVSGAPDEGRQRSSPDRGTQARSKSLDKGQNLWTGKAMDLPYFLEMVDQKHRYGSNLRTYHELWKRADTTQPYFWWLDHGDGKEVEHPNVSRKRLEREQVRYLSSEERLNYLVQVDGNGRLVWAKTGERITTSTEYRDSIGGIVSVGSDAKGWREDEMAALREDGYSQKGSSSEEHSTASDSPTASPLASPSLDEAERRYPDPPAMRESKGPSKLSHISAQAIVNRLVRKTLVAKNTWIFASDASDNLYIGIKQSGSFQHSSFMRGSRLSSAGTIKIKDGQIRAINPLSGHYRPPAKAFRHFVHHLKHIGVDMSRVSISKSYAVLVGLEVYKGGRKKMKEVKKSVQGSAGMVIHPAKTKAEREDAMDNSKSAQIERSIEREEKAPLARVLEDAKLKVEDRWAALDARRLSRKDANQPQDAHESTGHDASGQEVATGPYKGPAADFVQPATSSTPTQDLRPEALRKSEATTQNLDET